MLKKILLSSTLILFMSGCVTKEVVYQPVVQTPTLKNESYTFVNETLYATPKVSKLVQKIKALSTQTAYVDLNANQNIQVGAFLNISAIPNRSGYLKVMVIDPNGDRSLALPNSVSRGYLQANQTFHSNNDNFALKATKPTGLHYVLIIFSEQNPRLVMQQGMNGYNALTSDQDLLNSLQRIHNQDYGKSKIAIFPIRIYQ